MSMSSDSEANQPAVDNAAAKAAEEAILKDVGKTAGPRARRWSVRPDASNAPLEGKMAAHNLGTSPSSIPEEDDGKILLAKDEQIFLIGGDNDEIENHALMQAIRKPPDEREEHAELPRLRLRRRCAVAEHVAEVHRHGVLQHR